MKERHACYFPTTLHCLLIADRDLVITMHLQHHLHQNPRNRDLNSAKLGSTGKLFHNPDLYGSNWSIGNGKGNGNGDYSELRTIVRRDGGRDRNSTKFDTSPTYFCLTFSL